MQGSYAGARAAHMKVLYPDIVYGAIASSGTLCLFSCLLHQCLMYPFTHCARSQLTTLELNAYTVLHCTAPTLIFLNILFRALLGRTLTPTHRLHSALTLLQLTRLPPRPGVTHAAITNWQYMDVIRQFARVECSDNLVKSVQSVDKYLGKFWFFFEGV